MFQKRYRSNVYHDLAECRLNIGYDLRTVRLHVLQSLSWIVDINNSISCMASRTVLFEQHHSDANFASLQPDSHEE